MFIINIKDKRQAHLDVKLILCDDISVILQ